VLSTIQPSFSLFSVRSRRGPNYSGWCETSEYVLSGEAYTCNLGGRLSLICRQELCWNALVPEGIRMEQTQGLSLRRGRASFGLVRCISRLHAVAHAGAGTGVCVAVGGHGYDHGFGPYRTTLTSEYRSQLERDDSKVGNTGRSSHTLAVLSLPVPQVSVLYDNARSAIRDAVTPIWGALPSVSESRVISFPHAQLRRRFLGVGRPH
jgi:hypothetical protein